tara:strand:- start:1484 stop:1894 length:411 start_codon:yes stop_codon:yes gene_type:complete
MKFKTIFGATRSVKSPKKYLIDWEGQSKSNIQYKTKVFLKKFWDKNVVFEEFPVVGTRLSIDFFNASKKIAIEVQGEQHVRYTPFFHGKHKSNYIDQLKRDKEKLDFCKINDIKLVEVYYNDEINLNLFKKQGVIL